MLSVASVFRFRIQTQQHSGYISGCHLILAFYRKLKPDYLGVTRAGLCGKNTSIVLADQQLMNDFRYNKTQPFDHQ